METIGERVRKEREAQDIPRAELAAAVGMAKTTLADLEYGASKSTTKLHKIAARLGVRVEWLETGRGPKEAPTGVAEESAVYLSTGLPTTAAQELRPDFDRMAGAVRLLAEFIRVMRFHPENLFSPQLLENAYELVELVVAEDGTLNVVDFMAYMNRRIEERRVAIRPREDQEARA